MTLGALTAGVPVAPVSVAYSLPSRDHARPPEHRHEPPTTTTDPASTCQIRVAGHLDEHWSAWLDGFALTRGDDGTTVIAGPVTDQAQLHGVLARVRDLGVPLLSLSTGCAGPRAETTAHAIQPALERVLRTERRSAASGPAGRPSRRPGAAAGAAGG